MTFFISKGKNLFASANPPGAEESFVGTTENEREHCALLLVLAFTLF